MSEAEVEAYMPRDQDQVQCGGVSVSVLWLQLHRTCRPIAHRVGVRLHEHNVNRLLSDCVGGESSVLHDLHDGDLISRHDRVDVNTELVQGEGSYKKKQGG